MATAAGDRRGGPGGFRAVHAYRLVQAAPPQPGPNPGRQRLGGERKGGDQHRLRRGTDPTGPPAGRYGPLAARPLPADASGPTCGADPDAGTGLCSVLLRLVCAREWLKDFGAILEKGFAETVNTDLTVLSDKRVDPLVEL